jgi:putative NADH-flavin reductase
MNIFLLGGTGRTGRLVLDQALLRGHGMTAITRSPGTIHSSGPAHIVVGDPLRVDVIAPLVANHDVVISCLGQRSSQDASLLRDSAAAMVEAMHLARVRHYIVVSQGLLFPSRNPIIAILRLMLARHVEDSTAMEALVRASDLDWTIVRPPRLKDSGSSGGYRIARSEAPHGSWSIPYADLATFLLDEAENGNHKREIVGITSAQTR